MPELPTTSDPLDPDPTLPTSPAAEKAAAATREAVDAAVDGPVDGAGDASGPPSPSGPAAPSDPPARRTLRDHGQRSISRRVGAVAAASLVGFSIVFTGGYLVGARNPLLAPVRMTDSASVAGPTDVQKVYNLTKNSVVRVSTDADLGSGFLYRPDRVVTNAHVVLGSPDVAAALGAHKDANVTIVLADGRKRVGKVLGVDARLDVAVIALPADTGELPLSFADSRKVLPGQPAIVVGTPFGLTSSVTTGVISGLNRASDLASDPVQNDLIQTDAAVNPGNSGGPLLDASGGVIGLVTLRPDQVGGRAAQGVAFAVPSASVAAAVDQLERYGAVSHPVLGVQLATGDPDHGESSPKVVQVNADGPAAQAGLHVGDLVAGVGGTDTTLPSDVTDALVGRRAGDHVTVRVSRGGQPVSVSVTLAERPASGA